MWVEIRYDESTGASATLTCDDRKCLCARACGGPDTVKRGQRSRQLSEYLGEHIDPATYIPRTPAVMWLWGTAYLFEI